MVQPGSSGDTPEPHQTPTAPQAATTVDAGWALVGSDTSTSGDPVANLVAVLAGMENNFNRLALQIAHTQFRIAEIRRQHQKQ